MNKKERTALAKVVAEMKYHNNSVPEVTDYANRLLWEFPCLEDNMSSEKDDILEDNVVGNIGSFLRTNNNPLSLKEYDNKELLQKWTDTKYTILWDYLDESDTTLEELDTVTKDYHGIKKVVTSWEWRSVVKYHCEDGEFLKWCTQLL
jgi:hypothetical protein